MTKDNKQVSSDQFFGVRDGRLVYKGEITKSANAAIFQAYSINKVKPDRLVITSKGGEIDAGLELGNWVISNNLDVEVVNFCASSCANYVFTAGKRKYLHKDSMLVWHGSAWQKNWDLNGIDNKTKNQFITNYLKPMRQQETDFYARLGIDNLITVYGHGKLTTWENVKSRFGFSFIGWDFSLMDMDKLGVSNIVLVDQQWNWRKYRPRLEKAVKRITLDNSYEFKLSRFTTN